MHQAHIEDSASTAVEQISVRHRNQKTSITSERQHRLLQIKEQISSSIRSDLILQANKKNAAEPLSFRIVTTTEEGKRSREDIEQYRKDQQWMAKLDPESLQSPEEEPTVVRMTNATSKYLANDDDGSWEKERALIKSLGGPEKDDSWKITWSEDKKFMAYLEEKCKPPRIIYHGFTGREYLFFEARAAYYKVHPHEAKKQGSPINKTEMVCDQSISPVEMSSTLRASTSLRNFDQNSDIQTLECSESKLRKINFKEFEKLQAEYLPDSEPTIDRLFTKQQSALTDDDCMDMYAGDWFYDASDYSISVCQRASRVSFKNQFERSE